MSMFEPKVYLNTKECGAAVSELHGDCRDSMSLHRNTLFQRWLWAYNRHHDPSQFGTAAGEFDLDQMTFLPWPKQQVDVITAQVKGALADADPVVRLRAEAADGDEPNDSPLEDYARHNQAWINNQMERHIKYRSQLAPWLKLAGMIGTQWTFLEWWYDVGPQYGMVQDPERPDRGKFDRLPRDPKRRPKGRVRVTPVNCTDMFPDPLATGWDERVCARPWRFGQRQFWMPTDELARFIEATPAKNWVIRADAKKAYPALDPRQALREYLKRYDGTVKPGDDIWQTALSAVQRPANGNSGTPNMYRRMVRLVDHWEWDRHVLLLMTGDKSGDAILIEGPDSHPYKLLGIPFRPLRLMTLPNELWGMGIIEPIMDLCHQANVWFNLRNMHLAKLAGPIILCNTSAGLCRDDLLAYAGSAIDLKGNRPLTDAIFMQAYPDTTKELVNEIQWLDQQVQITAGATDYALGTAISGFNETVRGMAMIGEQLSTRKGDMVTQFSDDVAGLVEGVMAINRQYMTEAEQFAITGKNGKPELQTIGWELIQRGYEITVDARPLATNRAMRAQQHGNLAQAFSQIPIWNAKHAIVSAYTAIDEPHPEDFVNVPEEREALADDENQYHVDSQRLAMPPVFNWQNHPHHIKVHDTWMHENGADPVIAAHVDQHFAFYGQAQPGPQPDAVPMPENMRLAGNQQRFGAPEGTPSIVPAGGPSGLPPSPLPPMGVPQ
jgi:hypothetical protein